ncbi:SapC family protein [Thalassomonas sp. M1454]|uniref:SapC family protein n=1 Tax=Thalassomonas sp. M1454 TaxID=2594477 RepID=UPI00117CB876|nr:SapC family protein [Thalassomonas sp. M1454]TRX55674.1 SapC family protein [Thalassomonas sp. M1454]
MSQQNIQPLNKTAHANTKIKALKNFEHAAGQHLAPVVVHEFSRAAAEFPVVFVKNAETGVYQAVALFGVKPGENLYTATEKWEGTYAPASVTQFPLALVPESAENDKFMVVIATETAVVNEEEGNALFDENGEETEYLAKRKEALGTYYEHAHITRAFTKELADKDLLVQQNLDINVGEEKIGINGIYLVDEKKLNELSDEDYLALRKRGFLAPIYAHLNSMHQMHRLIQKKAALAAK